MKAAALLLGVAFGVLQGVSITDCPCGSYCQTKNSCPGENHHSAPSDDCCSRSGKPIENCFHLEPQSDVVAAAPADAPILVVATVLDDPPCVVPSLPQRIADGESGPSPPARDCPYFILHSSLLL